MQQPTMFCHDGTTIYYPTGPGRVHMISILALYDCDGSDEDFSDSTARGDVHDMANGMFCGGAVITPNDGTMPAKWPRVHDEAQGDIVGPVNHDATAEDFHDCLEMWADWCDRDAARIDSFDGPAPDEDAAGVLARLRALVVGRRADATVSIRELVEAVGGSQVAVAC